MRLALNFSTVCFTRLIGASMAALVSAALLDFSDCVVVGRMLGATALAGLELFMPAANVIWFFGMLIAGGTAILHAEAMGRFDRARADAVFATGVALALLVGVFLAAALLVSADAYLALVGVDAATAGPARAYWRGYALAVLLQPLVILVMTMMFEDGGLRSAIVASFAALAANVLASVLFCGRFGAAGCAFGTGVGLVVELLAVVPHLRSDRCMLAFRHRPDFRLAGPIVRAAIGDASLVLFDAVVFLSVNGFIARRFGSERLPIAAAVFSVGSFLLLFDAFANAAQPVMCVYFGERNFKALRSFAATALGVTVMAGAVYSLAFALSPGLVVRLLGLTEPALAADAAGAIRILAFSYVFTAAVRFLNSYYAFIGRPRLSAALSFLHSFAFPLGGLFVGGVFFGLRGVWVALACASPLALAVFYGALAWRRNARLPFLLPADRDARLWNWCLELAPTAIATVSAEVGEILSARRVSARAAAIAPVLVEETLLGVRTRNAPRRIRAEITLDLNDGVALSERDDGEIFDLTDSDVRPDSLGAYVVASLLGSVRGRCNLLTIGFNRNRFDLETAADAHGREGTS